MVLGGYKALLADTAGIRDAEDEIEAEGVRRARAWAEEADLRLWVVDGSGPGAAEIGVGLVRAGDLCLITKEDLAEGPATDWARGMAEAWGLAVVRMSAHSAKDIGQLREGLAATVVGALAGSESPTATRLRHRELLGEAIERLRRALDETELPELAAEDVRLASRALDRVTGRIHPEDVLDRVFASFCIGK